MLNTKDKLKAIKIQNTQYIYNGIIVHKSTTNYPAT